MPEAAAVKVAVPPAVTVCDTGCVVKAGAVLVEVIVMVQVTLAVLVSGWAHVLHAVYKPWGAGSNMYMLQHGSLFVTSFVFLMVRGVTHTHNEKKSKSHVF